WSASCGVRRSLFLPTLPRATLDRRVTSHGSWELLAVRSRKQRAKSSWQSNWATCNRQSQNKLSPWHRKFAECWHRSPGKYAQKTAEPEGTPDCLLFTDP